MAKYFYLRPSADISVEHSLVPADSPNAYSLINEEVSDGASTCVSATGVKGETVLHTSSFKMSGTMPSEAKQIINATVVAIPSGMSTGITGMTATVDGKEFQLSSTSSVGGQMIIFFSAYTSTAFVDAIKSYYVLYGTLPEITVSFTTSITTESDAKNVISYNITQVYIQVEYGIGALRKINNEWKSAYGVYRKSNGAWTLLEDGYSIVGSKLHRMGHHQEYLPAVTATCTTTGSTEGYKCSICGETLRFQSFIPATGHVDENGDNVCDVCEAILCTADSHAAVTDSAVTATCVTTGLTQGSHCSACGEVIVAQEIVPIDSNNHKKVVTDSAAVATCVRTGLTEGSHCSACDKVLVAQEVIPIDPNNHNYVIYSNSEECTLCGHVLRRFGLAYFGSTTNLSVARNELAATSIGNYALFGGGGGKSIYDRYATVDAYDASLTRTLPTVLSVARNGLAATSIGNYALFGGGYDGDDPSATVDAYDASLTRTLPTVLSVARNGLAATSIDNYALFGGGRSFATVDAYNTSLTRIIPTVLSVARDTPSATSVGNYALFGGGSTGNIVNGYTRYDTVDAYDTSLTRIIPTALSEARDTIAATSVGNYALFGGGYNNNKKSSATVDAYDASLTRTLPTVLSNSSYRLLSISIGNYAVFIINGNEMVTNVYNQSLTRTSSKDANRGWHDVGAAASIGNYAIFGGGNKSITTEVVNGVDVYVNYDM